MLSTSIDADKSNCHLSSSVLVSHRETKNVACSREPCVLIMDVPCRPGQFEDQRGCSTQKENRRSKTLFHPWLMFLLFKRHQLMNG